MREKWTERTFRFDLPPGRFPFLLERLRGTPARVEERVPGIGAEALCRRIGNTWSAQENVGHLADIEDLHLGRLDDFEASAAVLRAADMENRRTWDANHNAVPIDELLSRFRALRSRRVARLAAWPPDRIEQSATHPRLSIPMRVIDLAYFTAEHDDYHLARIHELIASDARPAPCPPCGSLPAAACG